MWVEVKPRWFWLILPLSLAAQDRWSCVRSGPFEVFSQAGERAAQDTLGRLEQFSFVLGRTLSREQLSLPWPLRVLVWRQGRTAEPPAPPALGRDSFVASVVADVHPSPQWLRICARMLLEANTRRLPAGIEEGLLDYYSMVKIEGVRVTVGQPPLHPSLDWAVIHLLSLHPDYYGKLRPLLYNLEQSLDPEPAWRNATGKTADEIRKEAAAYLGSANFSVETVSGRPMNPRADFRPQPVDPGSGGLLLADLRLSQGRTAEARALYEAVLKSRSGAPEPQEGLALAALAAGEEREGLKHLQAALTSGTRNARIWLEAARREPDRGKASAMLRKAAELNPGWAEPLRLLAEREPDANKRLQALNAAARLAPRDAALWRALAEAQESAGDFRSAARSWAAAEQAAPDEATRAEFRRMRRSLDERRREAEALARKREAEQKERELARVKEEAIRRIREAEARANREAGPPPAKVEPWFEGPRPPARVEGRLRQVDCLRGVARLVIETPGGRQTRLAVRDPAQVVVLGGGKLELVCGQQKPVRTMVVEYFPKADAALGTSGEVATVDYC